MLSDGCGWVEPRLEEVEVRTMVLAGGRDLVAQSEAEARRLRSKLQRAFVKVLPDSGHAPLSEPGVQLLTLMRSEGFLLERLKFTSPVTTGS